MSKIAVIIPTFKRAGRLEAVARNVLDNSTTDVKVEFVVEQEDLESVAETYRLSGLGLATQVLNNRKRTYAGAVNTAYRQLPLEFTHLFLAADDVVFHPGWDGLALAALRGKFKVAGTNDLHNPYVLSGVHATHYLIQRTYLDFTGGVIDQPNNVLFEGYDHNYTDTEFIDTAKLRGVFVPCLESVVEHLHPCWGAGTFDETYAKGSAHYQDDDALYRSRVHLWS